MHGHEDKIGMRGRFFEPKTALKQPPHSVAAPRGLG
jgi:hypothetical protein